MKRGKILGAIVLVGAIALIVAQRLNGPGDDEVGLDAVPDEGADLAGQLREQDDSAGDVAVDVAEDASVRVYAIDAAQSEVYWRIYRSGPAARFGHSHVISMGELEGSVSLGSDLAAASWNLSFPVGGLIIDDPDLRARHGEEFESVPSEDDKAGTKENMLSDRLLNGAVYPVVSLSGTGVTGPLESASLALSIDIVGRTIEEAFPASITIEGDSLTVTGEYQLTHEDLGLEPFTALGGMMAVGDEIDFTYRIHAVAGSQ
jgi:hypothetical protein